MSLMTKDIATFMHGVVKMLFLNLPLCRTFLPDLFISRTWRSGCLIPSFSLIPCVGRGYQLAIVVSKPSSSLLLPKGEALAIVFFTTYLLTLCSYAVSLWEAKQKLTTISITLSYHPCLFLIKWCAAVDYGWGGVSVDAGYSIFFLIFSIYVCGKAFWGKGGCCRAISAKDIRYVVK
jgi:hypothetical protein